jgi:hypothetical protein
MLHLFTVADRFQIENLGCILVPGLSTESGAPSLRIGARIRLHTPEGREIDTSIKDFAMISYQTMPEKLTVPVLLPKDLSKDDVPVGTDVLLLEEKYETITK